MDVVYCWAYDRPETAGATITDKGIDVARPNLMSWVTGISLAAVSLLALGCSQSPEIEISAEGPGTTTAQDTTAVTVSQVPDGTSTTLADPEETTPLTYRIDVTEIVSPEFVESDGVSFSSRIVVDPSDDGVVLLETQFLGAPDGTELVEIVVNGRVRGGNSYAPGVVGVLPLQDETEVEVEVRAYDADKRLLAAATLGQILTTEGS